MPSVFASGIRRLSRINWVSGTLAPLSLARTLSVRQLSQSLPPPQPQQLLSVKPITPNDAYVSCTLLNSKGDVTAVSQKFPKWTFLRDHGLYPRDLRKIDTSTIDIIPSIVVKPTCILINLLHIKALIQKNQVFVFDTSNPEAAMKLGVLMYDLSLIHI